MTYLTRITLVATFALGALGASAGFAGNGDMLRIKDQLNLHDGSCLEQAELLLADESLTLDQVRDQLRDCSCLLDDGVVDDDGDDSAVDDDTDDTVAASPAQTRTRTRTGEDNGKGSVSRARTGGGN